MEFDYQIYTADLLADKSIIPSLEHWPYEYDSQAHRTKHGFFPSAPPRESNNVIMQYISREETMTKSEDDLFKHLLRISESSYQDEGGHVFMAIDFSSWCTSFRFEGVTPLFEELDRLLGVKDVMAYTQLFPLESILLLQDRFHPPKQGPDGYPLNGPRCVHGPGRVDEAIEAMCRSCRVCAAESDSPPRHAPCPWPWPDKPWSRVALRPDRGARVAKAQKRQQEGGAKGNRTLNPGDEVWLRHYNGQDKWRSGKVTEKIGTADYRVIDELGRQSHKHIDQLKQRIRSSLICPSNPLEPGTDTDDIARHRISFSPNREISPAIRNDETADQFQDCMEGEVDAAPAPLPLSPQPRPVQQCRINNPPRYKV
ncbi:unnamed protein product [Arctia plantaginis]|uniref:RdRp catalytic domain-containing protein n=1 Tax=Arctia plantaginis TaxID=874455 RepID=A0A8S0Z2R4_ARCPL|nr:unnamed protein product [Arctia plantaginis]